MVRALTVLGLTACLMTPVLAQQGGGNNNQGNNNRMGGQSGFLNPYPAYERRLGNEFWAQRGRLTPAKYHRLRSMGFTREEVFFIANASQATGYHWRVFGDALHRGETPIHIAYNFGINPSVGNRVHPEWRTAEWAAATGESAYTEDELDW